MKANLKTIGIATASAALLFYGAKKLYQLAVRRRQQKTKTGHTGDHAVKAFSPAYRGIHKAHPHHRN